MRLVDQHDLRHELAHDRQRQLADVLHRDAFGQRRRRRRGAARRSARSRTTDRAPPPRRRSRSTGLSARAATALPAISPPPPIGITSMSRSGTSSSISSAIVPCPAITADVVIGMDPGEAALARQRLARCACASAMRLAFEHDLGAVRLRRLDLHERRRHRHDDGGGDAEPRRVVGDRLGVVAGRHGDDAARALLGASSEASLLSAPRSLNELVTWRFSYLT